MILLDSNVVINLVKPESVSLRNFLSSRYLCVSAITQIEVLGYHRLTDNDKIEFETFFSLAPIYPMLDNIITRATSLRQIRKMGLGDAIIAATALVNGLELATSNIKDFKWIDSLTLIDPFRRQMIQKYLLAFSVLLFCWVGAMAQDVRLKILEQPKPELPQNYSTLDIQGNVILRVEFLEIGEIGEITNVKTLSGGLTEKAVAAAKKIKFEPEKKDGKAVTVSRQIEYFYSWNGGWQTPANSPNLISTTPAAPGTAEAIIARAVQNLGGDRYMQIRTQVGKGKFSVIRDRGVVSFQAFTDVIVFPDKERTDFKGNGSRTIQVNTGDTGWVYDGDQELIKVQKPAQIANFKQGIRTSLDNLLRGGWKGEAELSYVGKRQSTLGKRNDVVKLTYKDGFAVEFEFATDDGMPQKAVYRRINDEGEEIKEEDRYAQFIEVGGIKSPFIVDRFTNGQPSSRINFETLDFNKSIPDAIFAKPATAKEAKKDLKW